MFRDGALTSESVCAGMFYLIVPIGTLIDWWIITRETVFILFYLIILSVFLYGNRIELWKALVLVVLYIIHIFLMKFSNKYEVAIKQALANRLEIKTLSKIAAEDITKFHMNLKSEAVSIEMLNKVHFTLRGEYIVFKDSLIRKKLKLSNLIKSGEEKYADASDKALMARKQFKEAVSMVIIKIQAYKHNLQIQRTQSCRQHLDKVAPLMNLKEFEDEDKIFGESYDSEEDFSYGDEDSDRPSEIEVRQYGSEDGDAQPSFDPNAPPKSDNLAVGTHKQFGDIKIQNMEAVSDAGSNADVFACQPGKVQEDSFRKRYEKYIDHMPAQQLPPSQIYEIIMNTFYNERNKIAWPSGRRARIVYLLLMPLTHLQYITIPNPMRRGKENLYPITLLMSMAWIWAYSFLIVWFTFDVTVTFQFNFNVLPMFLYPFGIALRDYKKKVNLEQAIEAFEHEISDQKMSLAETFSGPIFQITGLMGVTWLLYISLQSKDYISFQNESIQYQMPMLIIVVLIKYMILGCKRFKTSKKLFYVNLGCYLTFLCVIVLIDYRN